MGNARSSWCWGRPIPTRRSSMCDGAPNTTRASSRKSGGAWPRSTPTRAASSSSSKSSAIERPMSTNLVTLSVDAMSAERGRVAGDPPTARMKLRYGVNETLGWRPFALGAERERVWARLRDLDTTIIRIFAFSPWTPDPETSWPEFAAYIGAVLQVGAVPLITFAKLPHALDEVGGFSRFAERCGSVVARCIDIWGGDTVRAWWWSIGNKPQGEWAEGATFDHYRDL